VIYLLLVYNGIKDKVKELVKMYPVGFRFTVYPKCETAQKNQLGTWEIVKEVKRHSDNFIEYLCVRVLKNGETSKSTSKNNLRKFHSISIKKNVEGEGLQ
jgi:hypothetical protein